MQQKIQKPNQLIITRRLHKQTINQTTILPTKCTKTIDIVQKREQLTGVELLMHLINLNEHILLIFPQLIKLFRLLQYPRNVGRRHPSTQQITPNLKNSSPAIPFHSNFSKCKIWCSIYFGERKKRKHNSKTFYKQYGHFTFVLPNCKEKSNLHGKQRLTGVT